MKYKTLYISILGNISCAFIIARWYPVVAAVLAVISFGLILSSVADETADKYRNK